MTTNQCPACNLTNLLYEEEDNWWRCLSCGGFFKQKEDFKTFVKLYFKGVERVNLKQISNDWR